MKVVVLVSGGMDSVTALHAAASEHEIVAEYGMPTWGCGSVVEVIDTASTTRSERLTSTAPVALVARSATVYAMGAASFGVPVIAPVPLLIDSHDGPETLLYVGEPVAATAVLYATPIAASGRNVVCHAGACAAVVSASA
jgi:hypothetical protein